jgi:CRP/FNR family cyclic AMP-dependent transcriptional regulator
VPGQKLRIDETSHLGLHYHPQADPSQSDLQMPADPVHSHDLELAIASFRAGSLPPTEAEAPLLPDWAAENWQQLFRFTCIRSVQSGEALIRRGEPGRTLYFVMRGELEVIVQSGDGLSMGRVALLGAGSVLGELAFFDGGPRSAGAWALDNCEVAAMTPDQYRAFEQDSPDLACELIFALGGVLAARLRRTNARLIS